MTVANEELDALDTMIAAASKGQWEIIDRTGNSKSFGLRVASGYQCFFDAARPNDECSNEVRANAAFIGAMQPLVAQRLTATIREQSEEIANAHSYLDSIGAPRVTNFGVTYTLTGRIVTAIAAQSGGAE